MREINRHEISMVAGAASQDIRNQAQSCTNDMMGASGTGATFGGAIGGAIGGVGGTPGIAAGIFFGSVLGGSLGGAAAAGSSPNCRLQKPVPEQKL